MPIEEPTWSLTLGPFKDGKGAIITTGTVTITYNEIPITVGIGTDGLAKFVVPETWKGKTISIKIEAVGFKTQNLTKPITPDGSVTLTQDDLTLESTVGEKEKGGGEPEPFPLWIVIVIVVVIIVIVLLIVLLRRRKPTPPPYKVLDEDYEVEEEEEVEAEGEEDDGIIEGMLFGDMEEAIGAASLAELPPRATSSPPTPLWMEVRCGREPVLWVAAHMHIVLASLRLGADA